MSVVPYRFKYQLSDWTLLSWSRRLEVCAYGLDALPVTQLPNISADSHGVLLRSVPLSSEVALRSVTASHWQSLLRYVIQRFPRYFIDMAGYDFEAYKAKFSSKTRSTLTRKLKRYIESTGGALRFERFSEPATLERFWRLAREVSEKTYQERLLDAGLPNHPEYLEEAYRWAREDKLRAFLLFDRERPVSYLFCPIREDIVQYAYLGYDPAYQGLSVGTVLQWLALESLFAERRYRYFDFTEGESEHKRLFSTGQLQCANVALLRPTLTHKLLICSHRGFTRGVEALGSWLESHGLRRRIRKWLRFGRSGEAGT